MDGVLIDTEKYLTRFWRQAAEEAGLLLTEEDSYQFRSFASRYAAPWFAKTYGEQYDYWAIRERRKELMSEHLRANGIEKKDCGDELLCVLREAVYQTAGVTATDEERTRSYLSEIGILDLFVDIVCATMVERGKPFPDVYEYACRKIGRKPEECAAVEDSPNGVRAAAGAGCRVIMVPDLTRPAEELLSLIDRKAAKPWEIPQIIRDRDKKAE